ncbi:uncharacterized protein LOC122880756 [Siniperca chuatsi]|uniref:uncharacterized protein LOC122880756 n=1 Tax=Siniperca chuatsi TaxID=119488 RepID=UPI001CE1D6D7|nr:uncharacterized protein LOC122880756 [Siniperca chuatsi]
MELGWSIFTGNSSVIIRFQFQFSGTGLALRGGARRVISILPKYQRDHGTLSEPLHLLTSPLTYSNRTEADKFQKCLREKRLLQPVPPSYSSSHPKGTDPAWTVTGVRDVRHLSEKVRKHENTRAHMDNSVQLTLATLGRMNIATQLDDGHRIAVRKHSEELTCESMGD